ncbi:MAG: type VI secretion system baseplate subunit TssK [Alphaproteobacteria bacterium]
MRRPFKFLPYPVQWYEGMLLMPQHFQQADQLHHKLLEYHFAVASPYHWGVFNLFVDAGQFANGLFRVLSLEGILPDGTVIFFPQGSDEVLEVPLAPHASALQQTPLKIYLCLPEVHFFEDGLENKSLPRYESIEALPVSDNNTGENPIPLARLKPKLQLVVSQMPPARYVSMPLAEISMAGNAFVQTPFIPPLLRIDLAFPLGQACLELVQHLRDKISYLQGKIQNLNLDALNTQSSREAESIRKRLITGLLPLEAVLNAKGSVHPYELFKALIHLASQGATLRHVINVPVFPAYDHANLQNTFQALFDFMDTVLNNVEESYIAIPFEQQDRVYSLPLREAWLTDSFVLGFQVQAGMSEDDLIDWVQGCVIATDSFVRVAQDNRVLGAGRELIDEAPHLHLTPFRGTVLCEVKWDEQFLRSRETLHIFNISDTPSKRPQKIVLYVPNHEAPQAT